MRGDGLQPSRDAALAELRKAQTSLGAFPWWPGGPPSPYMTLYILYGFSKGLEFGVEVPRDMVVRAWSYMHRHYLDELTRATTEEKQTQLDNLAAFHTEHAEAAPDALARLKEVARSGGNVFEELMHTVRHASLGQISHALYEVGGKYRRNL